MFQKAFYNADGDFLIVLQEGSLEVRTEFGVLVAAPGEIMVIPRGIRYSVGLLDSKARGYVLEVFDRHFELPDLGPIGANGLANPRDFLYPVAAYLEDDTPHTIICKFQGNLFKTLQPHSPFDVVGWHGNYVLSSCNLGPIQIRSKLVQHHKFSIIRSSRSFNLHCSNRQVCSARVTNEITKELHWPTL